MKSCTRTLALACLAAFALLFAVSTPAQRRSTLAPNLAQTHNSDATAANGQQQKHDEASSDVDSCSYTFTSGTGVSYLQFCVTTNGNIVEFENPSGVDQIRQGGIDEGYGLCDITTEVAYYDYAEGGASGWGTPTTVTHTSTMVKIERTTSDGAWTLTQTINSVAGTNPYAKMTMALKNNSGESKEAYFERYADVDPGNPAETTSTFTENFDGDLNSAWGYVPYSLQGNGALEGLMIQTVGNVTPTSVPTSHNGYGQNTADGPTPCTPFANVPSPTTITDTDGSVMMLWYFGLNKEQTATFTARYVAF
jgi:hypothetical protein